MAEYDDSRDSSKATSDVVAPTIPAVTSEAEILAAIRVKPLGGSHDGFACKVAGIKMLLDRLTPAESRALIARVTKPIAGDELAAAFNNASNLVVTRREDLLRFLHGARAREARRAALTPMSGESSAAIADSPAVAEDAARSPSTTNAELDVELRERAATLLAQQASEAYMIDAGEPDPDYLPSIDGTHRRRALARRLDTYRGGGNGDEHKDNTTMTWVTRIASAPNAERLFDYQLMQMRRIRALLDTRTAEKRGDDVAELRAALQAMTEELEPLEHDPFPFAELCRALKLPRWLRDALLLIAAPHLVDGTRAAIARYWGHPARSHVDAALVIELLRRSAAEVMPAAASLREGGALHAAGLIESVPIPVGHTPSRLEHELIPTPRLLRIFDGEVGLDPRFWAFARLIPADADAATGVLSPERLAELVELLASAQAVQLREGARVLLAGSAGAGKVRCAQALAAATGSRFVLCVESAFLPTDPLRLGAVLKALGQEAEILGAQLVLRRIDTFVGDAPMSVIVRQCISNSATTIWTTSDVDPSRVDATHLADLAILRVSLALPDLELRRAAWRADLGRLGVVVDENEILTIGAEYPLSRSAIETAARVMEKRSPSSDASVVLRAAAESQMRGQLARFAKRSRSQVRLEQLVLTDQTREQVNELVTALRRRTSVMDKWGLTDRHATGRGLVTLFNGSPGTGKTMCAAAISNEIGQPLYRIDVSNVVDRFVGETEKNLVRMFDEAAASRAALLFDEADSLFSKRVEAKDSTDRYANMQVNLLLNLIEEYDGFVVLTTNLKGAIDDAFIRRITYKIVFEMPEHDELVALWEYHLPAHIPRAKDVDLEALADEFSTVAGGDIKNAVLRAALAAGGERAVTREMLRRSMISEIRANGGVVSDRR